MERLHVVIGRPMEHYCAQRPGTGAATDVITAIRRVTGRLSAQTGSNDRGLKEHTHKSQVREPI